MARIFRRGRTYWCRAQRQNREFRRSLKTTDRAVAERRARAWLNELDAISWGEKPRHMPMATARRQKHYGGFYLARSFIGPSHRTTLCVLGIRKGGRLDFGPHKNRHSGRLICAERHYI